MLIVLCILQCYTIYVFPLSLGQKSHIWWETHWKTKEKNHNWFRFVNRIYQIMMMTIMFTMYMVVIKYVLWMSALELAALRFVIYIYVYMYSLICVFMQETI